jgi:phage shock protein A
MRRVSLLFKTKTSATLGRLEDPRQTMDYAYEQQQELLLKVRRGLVDVATSKVQLEQQSTRLRDGIPRLEEQARRALALGREDLARLVLQRKHAALEELDGLERHVAEVGAEEAQLSHAQQQLASRLDEFRTRRTVLAARYTAAQSRVRATEAVGGISGELAELNLALGRAEEKTEQLQARASALDALLDADALSLPLTGGDNVERELRRLAAAKAAEEELAELIHQAGRDLPVHAGDNRSS